MSKTAKITITHVRPPADPVGPITPIASAPMPSGGVTGGVAAGSTGGFTGGVTGAGSALPPMPRLGPLAETLTRFDGKRAHLFHPRGDHGDHLAEIAAEAMLAAAGVYTVRNPDRADLLVVGSGGMADDFKGGFEPIESFARRYPVKPLVVLPSSFHLHAADVARVFMSRIEPAFVYAREQHSIDILDSLRIPWPVSIGLDHDVTFHLAETEYFQQLLAGRSEGYVLVVENRVQPNGEPQKKPQAAIEIYHTPGMRLDSPPAASRTEDARDEGDRAATGGVLHRLRGFGKRLTSGIARHRFPAAAAQTPFARGAVERLSAEMPALRDLPVYADDVARPDVCPFARFGELVAGAAAVATDRLPVAILASLLDKPTWVRPGTYHKVRGVFRQSLALRKNVRLI
jgi:hypothetical protein